MKEPKKLERIFKGVANHRRIQILVLIKKNPEITLFSIAQNLKANFKTIAEHTRRLVIAGLINKARAGNTALHTLSPYGERVYNILKEF